MGRKQGPRKGSLQIWPRKRSAKFLPRVNWAPISTRLNLHHPSTSSPTVSNSSQKVNLLGFIGYKVGMAAAFVKDNTADSMTKTKKIILPVTLLECPPMKILSVRFYKNKSVASEVLNDNLNKELKGVIRMPTKKISSKELIEKIEKAHDFDDIQLMVYSEVKRSELKKTPDISEVAISGSLADKIAYVKDNLAKEISVSDVFQKNIVDVRGLTKGKGFQGPIKRFGARLRFHKSEKGIRKIGSVGPWHPTGIRFRVPMAGQMGMFSRITYNNPLIASKKFLDSDPVVKRVFTNYGFIKTDYVVIAGSVQGPQKRQLLITATTRPSKHQAKRNYELLEIR
jgi:large subunit ribosomal protein L3